MIKVELKVYIPIWGCETGSKPSLQGGVTIQSSNEASAYEEFVAIGGVTSGGDACVVMEEKPAYQSTATTASQTGEPVT